MPGLGYETALVPSEYSYDLFFIAPGNAVCQEGARGPQTGQCLAPRRVARQPQQGHGHGRVLATRKADPAQGAGGAEAHLCLGQTPRS